MSRRRARKKRFDPLAPSFRFQSGFNRAVDRRARSQIRPEMEGISEERRTIGRQNRGREQQIDAFFGAEQKALKDASDRVNAALANIASFSGGAMGAGSNALAAILRGGASAEQANADMLGVLAPGADRVGGYVSAADAGQRALLAGLGGHLGASAMNAAAQPGISATGQRQVSLEQANQFRSQNQELDQRKRGLLARLPQLREEARAAILQEEQQRQAQRFQQRLANREFGLSERAQDFQEDLANRQQDETERQGRHGRRMDRRQMRLNEETLNLQREELRQSILSAGGENANKRAEQAAKRFDNAATWLVGYLQPGDQDKKMDEESGKEVFDQATWRQNRKFNDAYHVIMNRFGMSDIDALRVLMTSNIREWRIKAKKKIQRLQGIVDHPPAAPPGPGGVGGGPT